MPSKYVLLFLFFSTPIAAEAQYDINATLEAYRNLTQAEPRCAQPTNGSEIVVCANRKADRYRVPFIEYELGDPRAESVAAERERLQAKTTPCQEYSLFLVGCGSVGLALSTRLDGSSLKLRPLAK
jgi:hypothetical protein